MCIACVPALSKNVRREFIACLIQTPYEDEALDKVLRSPQVDWVGAFFVQSTHADVDARSTRDFDCFRVS